MVSNRDKVLAPTPDIIAGFRRIGLGSTYHHTSLYDLGELGVTFREWMTDGGVSSVYDGNGYSLWGTGGAIVRASTAFNVLARSLYLSRVRVRVLSLTTLIKYTTGVLEIEDLKEVNALFVMNFYNPHYRGRSMGDDEKRRTEDELIHFLNDGFAIFTLSDASLHDAKEEWSSNLINNLQHKNTELEIR